MAPEPPLMSVQWQIQNNGAFKSHTRHSDRGNDPPTKESETNDNIMDDNELHKLMALNGHNTNTNGPIRVPRKSVTKQYPIPQAPLHAEIAVMNEKDQSHFDEIVKNNPYKPHKLIKKPSMPITRPSNNSNHLDTLMPFSNPHHSSQASYHVHTPPKQTSTSSSYKHTITNMQHHQKESQKLDSFLQHRTPESVLKNKSILPSNNMQSNDDINREFWKDQKQKRSQIASTLSRKLSNKFRPQQNELYERGIYVTDPKVVYYSKSFVYTQFRTSFGCNTDK